MPLTRHTFELTYINKAFTNKVATYIDSRHSSTCNSLSRKNKNRKSCFLVKHVFSGSFTLILADDMSPTLQCLQYMVEGAVLVITTGRMSANTSPHVPCGDLNTISSPAYPKPRLPCTIINHLDHKETQQPFSAEFGPFYWLIPDY